MDRYDISMLLKWTGGYLVLWIIAAIVGKMFFHIGIFKSFIGGLILLIFVIGILIWMKFKDSRY